MKNILTILSLAALPFMAGAQVFTNNAATFTISTGAVVTVNGGFTNASSGFFNNGTLSVTGNFANNSNILDDGSNGNLIFNGTSAQTLSGTNYLAVKNVFINNAAGLTLANGLYIFGDIHFQSGIVVSPAVVQGLIFRTSGSGVSTIDPAKDASHVKGFVTKFGTGNFTYPVGDGIKYQPIAVNLSANNSAFSVKYNAADAGTAPFTAGGSEPVALASYNQQEYWDLAPISSATGTVTLFWDGYKDAYSNPAIQRRVAHKRGGNWLNEGSALTTTGNAMAGSVTSNSISTFSPFALGTVLTVLPVKWLSISGNLNANKNAIITWKVAEQDVTAYQIERSIANDAFTVIGTNQSSGNGTNEYSFTDPSPLTGTAIYRVKQVEVSGRSTYSDAVKLSVAAGARVSIYPNPAQEILTLAIPPALLNTSAVFTDMSGKTIQTIRLANLSMQVNIGRLAAGIYLVNFADGTATKFIKN